MKHLLVCLILSAVCIRAAEPEALLDALRAEVRTVLKGKKDEKAGKAEEGDLGRSVRYNAEMLLAQIPADDEALKDEQLARTLQAVEQLHGASVSDKTDEICRSLAAALRDRIAVKQKALKDRFDGALRSALATGLKAAAPKELDAPLQELARLQKELFLFNYRGDARMMVNAEAISAVEQILTTIQDAMLGEATPSARRGRDVAERLRSASTSYSRQLGDLMPRSEFLEKMQAVAARIAPGQQVKPLTRQEFDKKVQDILAGVGKLDDLEPALAKIDELSSAQREVNGYYGDSSLTYQLRSYRRTYDDLRAGSATSISFATISSSSSESADTLIPLRNLLVKFALTRVLGTSGDLAPKEEESVATYLHRVLDAAQQSSDWPLISRVLDAVQAMNLSSVVSSIDSTALRQFLAGVNMERAQQFSGAVASYLIALKSGSQAIPVEKIGGILEAIKKDHPQDYEAGVQASNSPAYGSSGYSRSVPPGFSIVPSSVLRESLGQRQSQVLRVPAVEHKVEKPAESKPAAEAPAKAPVKEPAKETKSPN